MLYYVVRRIYQALLAVIGVTLIVFLVLHWLGDPTALFLPPGASEEVVQAFRQSLGLDDPLYRQYARFLTGLAAGDIGHSYYYNESAIAVVWERMPATLELTAASLVVTLALGIPAGIWSAVRHHSWIDSAIRLLTLIAQCTPVFWLALLLVLILSVEFGLLPTSGRGGPEHLIMPALALGLYPAAATARLLRASMIDALHQEYIRAARARGLSQNRLILKHALKNAASSVVTMLGLHIANLLGGAFIIESIFAWPGIGRLAAQAIYNRDFLVVEAVVLIVAVGYAAINLLVDLCYALMNPKVRFNKGE